MKPTFSIPIEFALVDSKTQWVYWHVLHFLIVMTESKIDPRSITSDFEVALFNSNQRTIPGTARIGCTFHFKQALRHRLLELGMPLLLIASAMRPEMLGSLQNVPRNQIRSATSSMIKQLKCEGDADKWDQFFEYFERIWISGQIPFEMWNATEHDQDDILQTGVYE